MNLTKDDFFAVRLRTREVDLSDVWPGLEPGETRTVLVREMSGRDRGIMQERITEFHAGGRTSIKMANQLAVVVALCVVDEAGERIFTSKDEDRLSRELPATVLSRISDAALEVSGIGAGAEAEAEGNSDAAPSGEPSSY